MDFGADSIRDEKVKVLRAVRPFSVADVTSNVIRAGYARGYVDGQDVPGYSEEMGVAPDSATETYVAARWFVDSWRWHGVPFFLRTGKRLPKRATEIAVQFKGVPHMLFDDANPGRRAAQRAGHAHSARRGDIHHI